MTSTHAENLNTVAIVEDIPPETEVTMHTRKQQETGENQCSSGCTYFLKLHLL